MSGVSQAVTLVIGLSAVALVLRWRLRCGERDVVEGWEAPAALALSVALALVAALWLLPRQMGIPWAIRASDFGEHCQAVVLAAESIDHPGISTNRSHVAAWLVAHAGPGPLTAFLNSALVCFALLVLGVGAWARALHSRLAGAGAVLLLLAIAPVVELARTLSFYPLFAAGYALSAAAVAGLARRNAAPNAALCGLALGGIMLLGLRSLAWFVPLGLLAAALCLGAPWRRAPLRLAALALPIVLSFQLGRVAYPEDASSLERLVNPSMRYNEMGFEDFEPRYLGSSHFVWGRTPLSELPATLQTLSSTQRPDMEQLWPLVSWGFETYLFPWLPILVPGLLAAAVALRRRPRRLVALLGSAVPFLASAVSGGLMNTQPGRFMATSMPVIAVAGGLGLAALAQGAPGKADGLRPWGLALVLLLALCVFGAVPGFLSPTASWRWVDPNPPGTEEVGCYLRAAMGDGECLALRNPHSPECVRAFADELAAGGSFWPVNVEPAR